MRFYNTAHQEIIVGSISHAKTMYVCIINQASETEFFLH